MNKRKRYDYNFRFCIERVKYEKVDNGDWVRVEELPNIKPNFKMRLRIALQLLQGRW